MTQGVKILWLQFASFIKPRRHVKTRFLSAGEHDSWEKLQLFTYNISIIFYINIILIYYIKYIYITKIYNILKYNIIPISKKV